MSEATQFHFSLHKIRSSSACYVVHLPNELHGQVLKDRFTFWFDLSKFFNFKVTLLKVFTSVFKGSIKKGEMVL